jgi:hypothetical protein
MLFVALLKEHSGTVRERVDRRVKWAYPEGMQVVAEYWLQTPDPGVILVCKADHISQFWALSAAWGDVFDIAVFPAITAEDGLELLKQMIPD